MIKAVLSRKWDANLLELIKGSGLAFAVKLLAAGGAFLLNLVVARQLGAEGAGYFFLALSLVTLLAVLSMQGFNNVLVRFLSAYKAEGNQARMAQVYALAIKRIVPMALVVSLALFLLSDWVSQVIFNKPALRPVLAIMAMAILPIALAQTHGYVFQGAKRIVASMLSLSAALPLLLVPAVLILRVETAELAAWCYLLAVTAVSIGALLYWRSYADPAWSAPEAYVISEATGPLKSMFLIILMGQLTMWAGQLILGAFASAEDVALFASAQRTALLTSFVLIAVNAIAAPKFAEFYRKNDLAGLRSTAIFSGRLMSLIAVPTLLVMLIGAPWLMSLFGDEFTKAALLLQVLAIGQFINVISGSVGYLLQMTGHERALRNNMVVSTLIVVVLGPLSVHLYGAAGMAVITAVAVSTQNILSVYQVNKELGFNTMKIW
ncbi:oligosaccharide flippase family protein [Ferrimonas balearica]|uniref:oligosaccharide flippase family protein n=1 Tax=Ferrimonas balearica TaxID=44012 RepID=UPI001C586483|nr:oligosaccharide flippase family protein [Ferrimonas balearica]MBW3138226.1 oligosaccharide flippase family protein [Ferrimonas balearica]MBW3164219.1 oligosaccharide flippase family protein [Ferrimonas balearica]